MNATQILTSGTLKPDGTLELNEKPALAPGPVQVLIRAQPKMDGGSESWWEFLQRSRAELLAEGYAFRSKEEIDADLSERRNADERRLQSIQNLQASQG